MSKWVNTEKFEEFREERENDNSTEKQVSFARKWKNPQMGTINKPNEYHLRMLPDTDGNFYKKMMYHMFQSGESWYFIMCPKTHGMDNYCPWCAVTQLLYQGSTADKKKAGQLKRKEKFVGNTYIVKDPRDANEQDPEKHFTGNTYLYEFPGVVEGQIKKEITDTENGWGYVIFDPAEGHNMILRIGAKKPDANKKTWPDYTQSTFAKKPTALADTDEGIEEIMETVQSLTEYLDNSMKSTEEHEEILRSEMLWDDVEEEFERHMKASEVEEKVKEKAKTSTKKSEPKSEEDQQEAPKKKASEEDQQEAPKKKASEEDISQSDQALLDELSSL